VEIRSDRDHDFAVAPDVLWDAMTRVDAYRQWWPWLRSLDAAALAAGERWEAVVQPPLPYRLRFSIHLDEVSPVQHVVARVSGDISGSARLHLTETPSGSRLRLVSSLEPTHRVLQAVASVAAPVARYGHEWVLDTGLQQFRDRALP
jgi:uncharacterized protein YndB with AHSA1/START domain